MPAWQKVEIPPGGNFIGWGKRKGQYVEGRVLEFDEDGGKDFGGKPCPLLEVELTAPAASFNKKLERLDHQAGESVSVTGSQYELRRGLIAAAPARDDMIRIEMDGEDELDGGNTVKRFSIQIAKGAGAKPDRSNVRVVKDIESTPAPADDDQDEIPF